MTKIKLGFLAIALMGAVGAFAGKAADTITYEDANNQSITEQEYLDCPNTVSTLCGQKLDNGHVVETRVWDF